MASVAHAIERDLQARAGRVDAQMKDAVARCMQSKALADSIAAAVGTGLQVRMENFLRSSHIFFYTMKFNYRVGRPLVPKVLFTFSESSPGCWAILQLPCCPSKQGEL